MTTKDGTVMGTTKILDHGDPALRWNLVVLGDGYQASELAQFATDAQDFVDKLIATAPFDDLQDAINVFRVDVASTDSGADDPTTCGGSGATPATYFDAKFCNGDPPLQRVLEVNNKTAFAVAKAQVPKFHEVIVIVNSTVFGGTGGDVAVYSLNPNGGPETAIHELGHTAFELADEYSFLAGCGSGEKGHDRAPGGEPSEPNVTTQTDRTKLKWRSLVDAATPVPTTANPDCTKCDPVAGPPTPLSADVVGAFEGAKYFHCGRYRPQFDCKMRTLGVPFCAVCSQQIRAILTKYGPRDLIGRPTFLRVHDRDGFGGPDDFLDAEVIVGIDTEPGRFFGFQLRDNDDEGRHQGMLDTLRTAFEDARLVRLDVRPVGVNGIVTNVTGVS
jgi:IgA Peptidase M64